MADFPKLKDSDMADLEKYTADLANALAGELETINNEISETNQSIQDLEENVDRSIQNLQKNVNENTADLLATKQFIENSMKTMEKEGTSIHVSDSADYPCKLEIEGKSEQLQTEQGKNLFDINNKNMTKTNCSDVSIEEGSITITSTSVATLSRVVFPVKYPINEPITISFEATFLEGLDLANNASVYFRKSNTSLGSTSLIKDTTKHTYSTTINNIPEEGYQLWLYVKSSSVEGIVKIKFENIQVEVGEESTVFEPFISDSPSPNYPSKIENLSGNLEIKATAKNILPRTFAEDLLKRLNISSTDNYLVEIDGKNYFKYPAQLGYQTEKKYFIKDVFEENTQYIFKLAIMKKSSETDGAYNISIRYTDGSGKAQGNKFINWTNMTEKEAKIISEEGKTIKEIGIAYSEGTTYINLDRYILRKLEAGMDTNKIEYEPCKEQSVTFPFTEGQKLMKDGHLGKNGIVNKRKQIVLTGNENWSKRMNTNNSFNFYINKQSILGISTHYLSFIAPNEIDTKNGIYLLNTLAIIITDLRFTDATEFKNWLAEQYGNGTPVVIEYELAEEETTPYTEEQATAKKQIDALKTYRTVTNVSNSQNTNMVLTYKKDLQTQFQELETMLLESGV